MSSVKVHNLNGTADCVPKDGADSWLAWWKKKSGKIGLICANTCCSDFAKLGGHVQKDGETTTNRWYIVPLCDACNKRTSSFSVPESDLVEVND